jgi:hypothetical protein
MGHEHDVERVVNKEFRRRGVRRVAVRGGLVVGFLLGGLGGAAIPTQSTYTDALQRQANVEHYAADAILDRFTSILSVFEGGKEAAFLRAEKIDPKIKDLYRDHRRKAAELSAAAKALTDGVQSLPLSLVNHPLLAMRAGFEGLGKPDLLRTQVYKQAGAGALAGSVVGWMLAAMVTRRKDRRS